MQRGFFQPTHHASHRLKAFCAGILLIACQAVMPFAKAERRDHAGGDETQSLVLFGARIVGDALRARMVLEFDRDPDFQIRYLDAPYRVVIDLPRTGFAVSQEQLQARGPIEEIRYGLAANDRSRLIVISESPLALNEVSVDPIDAGTGFRFVSDFAVVSEEEHRDLRSASSWLPEGGEARSARPGSKQARDRAFTIVIDPGHGGIDTGATGRSGTIEKHVTLAFAREMVDALSVLEDTVVLLTREEDEFISLGQRVRFARENNADLFISVHADSIRLRRIRGATVYTLSDRASDDIAAELAARDVIPDLAAMASERLDPSEAAEVAGILVDLTRRETRMLSVRAADKVVTSFEGEINLINNPHRHAGFRVLRAPDVPSVLLELGYLSNPQDEKLLVDPLWRRQTAALLVRSIKAYRDGIMADGS